MKGLALCVVLLCGCGGSSFTTGSATGGNPADAGYETTGGTSMSTAATATGGTATAITSGGDSTSTAGAPSTNTVTPSGGTLSGTSGTTTATGGASDTAATSTLATGGSLGSGGQGSIIQSPTGGAFVTGGSSAMNATGGNSGTGGSSGDPGRCPCAYTGQCQPRYNGCWSSEPGSPYTCVKSPLMCGSNPTTTGVLYCYEC